MPKWEDAPFARFMEEAVQAVFEYQPTKICVCARFESGETLTAYYGANAEDKALFAHNIQSDALLEVVRNNAREIKDAIDRLEEDP